jgi:glyoxylase I family protein
LILTLAAERLLEMHQMSISIRGLTPLLQVFDMTASLRFYRDVLGFKLVSSSTPGDDCDWALLSRDGAEIMLNTAYERESRPSTPDPSRIAAHDDTCLYFGCPDVDAAYEHLAAHGIAPGNPSVAPYGMKQLYVHDPDGYNLCFQWPATQETLDQWRQWYGREAAAQ